MKLCTNCICHDKCTDIFRILGHVLDPEAAKTCRFFKHVEEYVKVTPCKECANATVYSCKNDFTGVKVICKYRLDTGDPEHFCKLGNPRNPQEEIDVNSST